MKKDILFYSNFCVFSKEVLALIQKLDVRNHFMLVCVEKFKDQLPPSINSVPTVMTVSKDIYVDDDISRYVQLIHANAKPNQSAVPEDNISATAAGFSFIECPATDAEVSGGSFYGVFGMEQRIDTPDEDGDMSEDATINYERYKAQRDTDIQIPKT